LDAVDDIANANGAIEANADKANMTDMAHEAFDADEADKAYVAN
jgi:hypothetical protein